MKVSQWPRPKTSTKHASFLQNTILQHSQLRCTKYTYSHLQESSPYALSECSWLKPSGTASPTLHSQAFVPHLSALLQHPKKLNALPVVQGFLNLFIFKHSLFIIASLLICSFPGYCPRISDWVLLSIEYLEKQMASFKTHVRFWAQVYTGNKSSSHIHDIRKLEDPVKP